MNFYRNTFFVYVFLLFINFNFAQTYLDSTAALDDRVDDLLSRMTLAEKIGQMTQPDRSMLKSNGDITAYFLGSLLSGGGSSPVTNNPTSWADMYDSYQAKALATRLKIPLIYGIDAVHGHNNVKGAVIFPHNIGLGATGNPELVKAVSEVTAREVAGTGIDWTFAPCIAVPRDERWGRTYEGFGETPELQQLMAVPAVTGLQGDSLSHPESILACAKHYVGDGGTTGGTDQGNTEISEEELRAIHLPGYIDAINAGVGSIMASYNSWNGEKLHGHYYLLTTVLKEELGFEGFVVSDWAGIDQLPGDYASDVETAINAGIDMVMVPDKYETFISTLTAKVNAGDVPMTRIDDAVSRILKQKFLLGLFERPYTDRGLTALVGSDSHRQVARQSVRESLVLLQKKEGILPLLKNGQKIHVSGKSADNLGFQCGGWTISWQGGSGDITIGTTVLEGLQNAVDGSTVTYSEDGAGVGGADLAIAVIGETPYAEGAGDKNDLSLDPADIELVRSLKSAGIPVVVVLISGRPMLIDPIIPYSDAIFAAWLPGTEGDGIADILFGDYEPSGKLGHSWPKRMDQIPVNLGDEGIDPLYPYGFGITSLDDSPAGSDPVYYSSTVNPDGNSIDVGFNKEVIVVNNTLTDFVINVNNSPFALDSIKRLSNDTKTIRLHLANSIAGGDQVMIEYNGASVHSTDGGILQSFGPVYVYNILNESGLSFFVPTHIEAENYFDMFGVQTEDCADEGGGLNVGYIDNGDWMTYKINVPATDSYPFIFRIASESTGGQLILYQDNVAIATIDIPVTGGWQNWQSIETTADLEAGQSTLKLYAQEGGFNINWFKVNQATDIEMDTSLPFDYQLYPNYPNPFNPETTIRYYLPVDSKITIEIFSVDGKRMDTIVSGQKPRGFHTVRYNAADLSSGVYFYCFKTPFFQKTRKMILIK